MLFRSLSLRLQTCLGGTSYKPCGRVFSVRPLPRHLDDLGHPEFAVLHIRLDSPASLAGLVLHAACPVQLLVPPLDFEMLAAGWLLPSVAPVLLVRPASQLPECQVLRYNGD